MRLCDNNPIHEVDETKEGHWLTLVDFCDGEKFMSTLFLCDRCFYHGEEDAGGSGGMADYGWSDGKQVGNSETFATLKLI